VKKTLRIVRLLLYAVVVLLLLCNILLQSSNVQTWLTGRASAWLTEQLGTKVTVGRVDIDLWTRLVVEDIFVEDHRQDTLAYIPSLKVSMYNLENDGHSLSIGQALLDRPYFNLKKYSGDTLFNYSHIIQYVNAMGSSGDSASMQIKLKHLSIVDGVLLYNNDHRTDRTDFGIDWNHMALSKLDVQLEGIEKHGDTLQTYIHTIRFEEKSGFILRDLSAILHIDPNETSFEEATISTNSSDICGNLRFGLKSLDDLDYFDTKVPMRHELEKSELLLHDLSYFSNELEGWHKTISLSGQFRGTIANLRGKNIAIQFDDNTSFDGNFHMEGLPNIDETFIDLDINHLTTNQEELDRIQIPPFHSYSVLTTPKNVGYLGQINYSGNFTGFINDFVSKGIIETAIGKVQTDITLKEDVKINDYIYSGNLVLNQFDLGTFYQTPEIGFITSDLRVEGKYLNLKKMDADFTGVIQKLGINQYDFSNITVEKGNFKLRRFNGTFNIDDPNVQMEFDGNIDFNSEQPVLDFTADIIQLNLDKIHVLEKYGYHNISGQVAMRSSGFDFEHFDGFVRLSNMKYASGDNGFELTHFDLQSSRRGLPLLTLSSDLVEMRLEGEFDFSALPSAVNGILSKMVPHYDGKIDHHRPQQFDLKVKINDLTQITSVYAPELYLSSGTTMEVQLNEMSNEISIIASSPFLQYENHVIKNLLVDIQRPDEGIYLTLLSDQLKLDGDLDFPNFAINGSTEADSVYTSITWGQTNGLHKGDLNTKIVVEHKDAFSVHFGASTISLKDFDWTVKQGSMVQLRQKEIEIPHFEINNGEQQIVANGYISKLPHKTLNLTFSELDVSMVNSFLQESPAFYGVINGTASLRDLYNNPILMNDVALRDFKLNDYLVGYICVKSSWDNIKKKLRIDGVLEKDVQSASIINKLTPLHFAGFYRPDDQESPLDLIATVQDLDLAFINEFLSQGVLTIAGNTSGTLTITGRPENPQLAGDAILKNASIFIPYLNTTYHIDKSIGIYPDMFTFDSNRVLDEDSNAGELIGTILHNNFSDWNFDLNIDTKGPMLALNTNEELNSMYYGKAYASGSVNIFGYDDQLEFDCNLKSEAGTVLAMPMSISGEQTFENFVRFISSKDTLQETPLDLSGLKLNFDLDITPDAEFKIIFDESVGDVMQGNGQGHIKMEINNLSTFNMYGVIEVLNGDYLFTLKNLINKNFSIKPGGTISWYGDPFLAELNMSAVYRVSASLYDLMPDPQYQNGQRVPVNLEMLLTDKMFNPNIDFNIALPTVDGLTRNRVNSIISSEQERNRQAFSLLVLRRFVSPPNVTSDHNSTNAFAAQSSEFLSNQVSNWLSQVSDDFNLGFNYSPGDDITNEDIALALNTQLFNNKIAVSTNFGVSRSTSSANQNATNLIGDIRVEYKMTEDGKLRLVVYNESNNFQLSGTQQSPYTQGVGILYREEFDNFEEMMQGFKDLLKGKKDEKSDPIVP
jgi:hypothetical protein